MELKRAPMHMKAKEVDRENYRIYFVFSTATVDRHGEVIDQKGWKLDNYLKNPVVLWGHDQRQFPIGRAEGVGYDKDGNLGAWVRFAYTQNPQAAIAFELCADDFLNAGSVGFMNLKWMYDEQNDLLTLLENELYEYSIVNVPANPEALAKSIEGMKTRGVDMTVIEGVEAIRKELADKSENRFKDLGDEVKEGEAAAVITTNDAAADTATQEDEPTTEDVKGAVDQIFVKSKEKFELDPVIKALEVLVKAPAGVLKEAVQELVKEPEKSKDADIKGMVDTITPAPQGRTRRYDVNEVNRVLRLLKQGQ